MSQQQVSQAEAATSKKKRSTPSSNTVSTVLASQPAEDFDFDVPFASQPKYTEYDIMTFDAEDKQNRANKKAEDLRKRKLSDTELDEEDDPVCKALAEQQNRRQRRTERSAFDGIFTKPKQTAVGVDYDLQDPYDSKFFHNRYCYQVKNMRLRRSRLGNKHYIHLLKLTELPSGEVKPGDRYSFPADILPGVIQVASELENEIQAYM